MVVSAHAGDLPVGPGAQRRGAAGALRRTHARCRRADRAAAGRVERHLRRVPARDLHRRVPGAHPRAAGLRALRQRHARRPSASDDVVHQELRRAVRVDGTGGRSARRGRSGHRRRSGAGRRIGVRRGHHRPGAGHDQLDGLQRGLRRPDLEHLALRRGAGLDRRPGRQRCRQPVRLPGRPAQGSGLLARRDLPLSDAQDRRRQLDHQPGDRKVVPGQHVGGAVVQAGHRGRDLCPARPVRHPGGRRRTQRRPARPGAVRDDDAQRRRGRRRAGRRHRYRRDAGARR